MLIGYRFERTAQGDLHIHTRNRLMDGIALLLGPVSVAAPVVFMVCVALNGGSPLVDVEPFVALLMVLGALLLSALGLVIMVYTGYRETLLLSKLENQGKRRTRNFFGRRERVLAVSKSMLATALSFAAIPTASRSTPSYGWSCATAASIA